MALFHHRKTALRKHYDPQTQAPALLCSICTGEQTAGFRNLQTNAFADIMLIRSPKDLDVFCAEYGVDPKDIEKIY